MHVRVCEEVPGVPYHQRWFVFIPEQVRKWRCDRVPPTVVYFYTEEQAVAFCKACGYTYEVRRFAP